MKKNLSTKAARRVPTSEGWKESYNKWKATKAPVARFGLIFGGLMVLFYGLALTPFCDETFFPSYLHLHAVASSMVLDWLGHSNEVAGSVIRSAHFAVTIRRGCDALDVAWFFCAALIAFPSSWSVKWKGMVVGVFLLQSLNIVRIVSLYLIRLYHPSLFAVFHLEIWPAVFIVTCVLFWLIWTLHIQRGGRSRRNYAS